MLDIQLRENGPPDTFDNTIFSYAHKCPRALYWFLRRLDQADPPAYFAWGRAWGAGLNEWHRLQGDCPMPERLQFATLKALEEWEKEPPQENGDNTWQNLEDTLELYAEVFGEEENWTMTYDKGEIGFALPIPGTSILYAGSIDAPITWPGYGKMIREDKTTGGYVTISYVSQWEYASQVIGYLWAIHQVLGETPYGALMNIASKRKRKKGDEALRFGRIIVEQTSWELAHFIQDTIIMADDIRREWDRWIWPKLGKRDPINCTGGMGRSPCVYRRLCQIEMEPWDLEESYDFGEEFTWRPEWKPWERSGENE